MKDPKKTFHIVSYLQYPFVLVALYFVFKPLLFGRDSIWEDYNIALVFYGLTISLMTLQDSAKTDALSKRIFKNPKRTKRFLVTLTAFALLITLLGIYCLFGTENANLKSLSFGIISIGIGLIGVLKAAIEMAEALQK